MPLIAQRPQMIESPPVTADMLAWESYDEVVRSAGTDRNGDPVVYPDATGRYVRRTYIHDPATKQVVGGVLKIARRVIERPVALTQRQAQAEGADLWFCVEGQPIYGQRGVWMRNGVKPETDPALYYQAQARRGGLPADPVVEWEPVAASEQAAFIEQQRRERQTTAFTQIVEAAVESPVAQEPAVENRTGRKGA